MGGRFSVAGIALASPFFNMRLGGEEVDARRWPQLARFLEAVATRPAVASASARLSLVPQLSGSR